MRKFDIARMLAKKYGFTSYLEVVTPTTGGTFSEVDRIQFSSRVRLMYRCPPDFSDGETIDLRTEEETSERLYLDLISAGRSFDLVFVDPFHTYPSSLRDIVFGLQLVRPGGMLLIHDCDPPGPETAAPQFREGEWCGVTYVAFLDTVLFNPGLHYVTVDADYGCGVVSRRPRRELMYNNSDRTLAAQWRMTEPAQKYSFFKQHRARLLHLVSAATFARPLESPLHAMYRRARRTARDVLNALTSASNNSG